MQTSKILEQNVLAMVSKKNNPKNFDRLTFILAIQTQN